MDWSHYRFRSLWTLPAPPDTVYAVLEHPEDYPRWWPQVRQVTRLDDRTATARIRSFLPYTLAITLTERRHDPTARVLEAAITGDVEGWARWTLTATPTSAGTHHTQALYEQEVHARTPLLRRLAVPGRTLFRANHILMMRAGQRGLTAHLQAV